MKAVLISIQPKWCEKIASGEKTVEVRKTRPKIETPFKCYIYETKGREKFYSQPMPISYYEGRGKVIGEFVCDRVYQYASDMFRSAPVEGTDISTEDMTKLSCLTAKQLYEYEHSAEPKENCIYLVGVYGWHISDLVIYGDPKPLSKFMKPCENDLYCESCAMHSEFSGKCGNKALVISRPPQSWCYVEVCDD